LSDSAAAAASVASASPLVDSVARQSLVPGVVGKVAPPTLRGAAPALIPPTIVAVVPAPALSEAQEQRAELSRRAQPIGTTWTVIAAEPARKILGTDVARVPGIPVRDILQNPQAPGELMVEQEVADGTVIQLLQSRRDSVAAMAYAEPRALTGTALRKTVGHLQVRISGPLAQDSLLKLLELVR
jgi:hypothetical protein